MGDAQATWARRNLRVVVGLLAGLVALLGLVLLGQRWAVWAGFAFALMAVVAFFVNLYQPPARQAAVLAAASPSERRRASRLLRGRRPVPEEDSRLVEASARSSLHSAGLAVWSGPMLAGSNLDAVNRATGGEVFGLVVLVLALVMTGLWVWVFTRVLAHLDTCRGH